MNIKSYFKYNKKYNTITFTLLFSSIAILFSIILLLSSCNSNLNPDDDEDEEWTLVWSDEFDGTEIDSNKWMFEKGGGGWGTGQLDYATDNRPENARVENGKLILTIREESYGGCDYTSSHNVN